MDGIRVAIIGGSIAGMSIATVLLRLGCYVRVFEKSPTPFTGRGGSIGYLDVNLWESLRQEKMIRRGVRAH